MTQFWQWANENSGVFFVVALTALGIIGSIIRAFIKGFYKTIQVIATRNQPITNHYHTNNYTCENCNCEDDDEDEDDEW